MRKRTTVPIALTIAGSDSGGGAGVAADLKTFAALGVHGTAAVTCLTAQNPRGISGIQPATPAMVRQQLEAVFAQMPAQAVKTGMLYSTGIIREVVDRFRSARQLPLIVDPVSVATSGVFLLQPGAMELLKKKLLPLATLVTPNVHEAQSLLGIEIRDEEDLREAARKFHNRYGCAALVKGGHLPKAREAVDIFFDGETELLLSAPFVRGISTHGTGCVYSAAIAAYLALGRPLPRAVAKAKEFITEAITQSIRAAGHDVLNPFWQRSR